MVAIHAPYSIEVQESPRQRLRSRWRKTSVETPLRTANHGGRTNHHHHLHIKAPRSHRNGRDCEIDGRYVWRAHPAEVIHETEQLIRDLHSRQERHKPLASAFFITTMGKEAWLPHAQRKTISGHAAKQARKTQGASQGANRTLQRADRSQQGTHQKAWPRCESQETQDIKVGIGPKAPHTWKRAVPTARVRRKRQPPQSHACEMPFRKLKLKHSFQQPGQGPSEEDKAGRVQLWGQEPSYIIGISLPSDIIIGTSHLLSLDILLFIGLSVYCVY